MRHQSRARSTDRRYYGLVEAIVTHNDDPLHEGRVRVRFPWFDPDVDSDWCRVSHFYAGGGYGAFFVPEVGDEVVIAFVHGDMRLPIVLGGVYNGVDKPVTFRTEQQNVKGLRTQSGHEIMLTDTEGKEEIRVSERSGKNVIRINTQDNSITIESTDGKLILKGNEIEISATSNLTMRSGQKMKIDGGFELKVVGGVIHLN